jgi:hypothetical protein
MGYLCDNEPISNREKVGEKASSYRSTAASTSTDL